MEKTNPHIVETIAPRDDQNKRYWITISSFIFLVALSMVVFYIRDTRVPVSITLADFVLLSLASFRLIRLFTYDQVMRAVRDLFVEKREIVDEHGQILVIRRKVHTGARRSLGDLFSCPWCIGMWVSFFVVLLYFLFPPIKYVVLILALAGVASSIQIVMNGIGSKAEFYKRENNIHN
jgi:hypothetical protein